MIKVENLTKEFKINSKIFKAVDNVSFNVEKGEIYGIIGLSGAGKSTLVRCLNRLEEPTDGKIIIDGENIVTLDGKKLLEKRREIGMIFQNFNLFYQKNVYDNIAFPLKLMGMSKTDIDTRVNELLEFIDLVDKKYAYPSEISGGQKQRVAIARAIATRPKLLLSDEGTSALDPANAKQIIKLLKRTVKEYDMTIVMITHQMEIAKDICDRIAVMESGKIIEENTVEQLFRNPKKERTRSLIETMSTEEAEQNIDTSKFKGTIFRISYDNDTTKEPMLSNCIKKCNVDINLISGRINSIDDKTIGHMYVEIIGDRNKIYEAKDFLESSGLIVEVK